MTSARREAEKAFKKTEVNMESDISLEDMAKEGAAKGDGGEGSSFEVPLSFLSLVKDLELNFLVKAVSIYLK